MMQTKFNTLGRFSVSNESDVDTFESLVDVSIPIKRSAWFDSSAASELMVRDTNGLLHTCDIRTLSQWPDGSTKWVLLTLICTIKSKSNLNFELLESTEVMDQKTQQSPDEILQCGVQLKQSPVGDLALNLGNADLSFAVKVKRKGKNNGIITWERHEITFDGFIVSEHVLVGVIDGTKNCQIKLTIVFCKANRTIKLKCRIHNSAAAIHEGGFWGLGDQNSVHFEFLSITFEHKAGKDCSVHWSVDSGVTVHKSTAPAINIHQYSSGGAHWNAKTHMDSTGKVPLTIKGFISRDADVESLGQRANPIISVIGNPINLSAAVPDFWQKFPSQLSANSDLISWSIFPLSSYSHELQPGEATSREIFLSIAGMRSLANVYKPLVVKIDVDLANSSKAVDWVTTSLLTDGNHQLFFNAMLEGNQSFLSKREAIDEFGWRNYGDVWADHEEPFAPEAKPIISHYNNQYDLLHGTLRTYLSTGDQRWLDIAIPLAKHIIDIDRYQTTDDKAGFNGGLFWHTAHYRDADTSSHRSYCAAMKHGAHSVPGGGPGSNEQNYTSGLKLYFELTGDLNAKSAVLEMGDWVIAMDDGELSIFAPFSSLPTGKASSTAQTNYHGPGRGVGNSINCLLDAWQLSCDQTYLKKCDELIKRVVHPNDEITKFDLLNAELRWSYTVCLQSLIKYLLVVEDPAMSNYVLAVLKQYGQWMLAQEKPYFENVAALEFPTETWHAQDLRKGNIMIAIAQIFSTQPFSFDLKLRGEKIRDFAWQELTASPTKFFTRPCTLVLQQLPIQSMIESGALVDLQHQIESRAIFTEFGNPTLFTSQKSFVMAAAKNPSDVARMLFRSAWIPRWQPTIREVKPVKRLKKLLGL